MTNSLELKALIVKNGLTQQELAKKMGISFASLNMKIHNKRQFKSKEILFLRDILHIENIDNIFFA